MTPQQALNALTKEGRLGTLGTWLLILVGATTIGYLGYKAVTAPRTTA